jgi:ectoine hydroxylase-related dioxygenase (phytanoyl-CoA dioxygenase family)
MGEAEAAIYRARLEAFEGRFAMKGVNKPHLFLTWVDALIRHPRILDAVEDLLGPDLLCWSSSFFIKEPREGTFISWHQDATYWGLSSTAVATVWLALSPSTKASGCVKFVHGTHLTQVRHTETHAERNLLSRGQEVAVEVDERDAVHAILSPGQASIHHVLLFHGSEPNESDDRRIGLAIRYTATDVRQLSGARDTAVLVRGRDAHGNFELLPPPIADLDPAGLALHARITGRPLVPAEPSRLPHAPT